MKTRPLRKLALLLTAFGLAHSAANAGTFTSDFSNPSQTGFTLNGGFLPDLVTPYPAITNGHLILTYDVGSLQGAIVLDDLDGGAAIEGFTAAFKLQIAKASGTAADGTSFNFGPDITSSSNPPEEGSGTGISVVFDVYDNGGKEAPAIDVKYGGVTIAHTLFTVADMVTSQFEDVIIQLTRSGTLNVTWKGIPVYRNLVLPGYVPSQGQFAIGSRTGGSSVLQAIDDLNVTTSLVGPDAAPTITAQPQNLTVDEHGTATLTVGFDGTAPLTFQWKRNGVNITDATAPAYTITNVPFSENGKTFSIGITNAAGGTNSLPATLTVNADISKPTIVSVTGSAQYTNVTVVFSEPVTAATAGTVGNYGLSGGLTISPTVEVLSATKVRLTTSAQTPGTTYTLTVNNVQDTATLPNTILAGSTKTFTAFLSQSGGLTIETWLGITGATVQTLLDDPRYQADASDESGFVDSFNTRGFYPDDTHENYGGRMWGWLVPTETADYNLFLRSDDDGQLFLSTNALPQDAVMIAEQTGGTRIFVEPGLGDPKTSEVIHLVAGQRYYVYALWKEAGGNDYCQVAWRKTTDLTPASSLQPIPGTFLQTLAEPNGLVLPTVTTTSPANGSILDSGASVTITATATAAGSKTITKVEFFQSSNKIGERTAPPYQLVVSNLADNVYTFSVRATDSSTLSTSSVPVNVSIGGPKQPVTLFTFTDGTQWSYNNSGDDLGTTWKGVAYNDSAWPKGLQPLGDNNDHSEVVPIRTFVSRNNPSGVHYTTLYVRAHFNFSGCNTTGVKLNLRHQIDDGAVFYLNGVEVNRYGLAAGDPFDFSTLFADHEASAIVGPIEIPVTSLMPGDNVFAAEIHQVSTSSSDIVYGAELIATVPLVPTVNKVLAYNDSTLWRYNNNGDDLGTAWRATNYNDSAWLTGLEPLGDNNDHSEVVPIRTFVSRNNPSGVHYTTLYARSHFAFPGTNLAGAKMNFTHQIDDGAVFYLNGVEVNRFGLAAGDPFDFSTLFADHEASAIVGPIDIPITNVVVGDNVFAAEIHQVSTSSSDIVFGAEVTTTTYSVVSCDPPNITSRSIQGGVITIQWINGGTLEWKPNVNSGIWTTTGNSSGSFSEPATNGVRFYRVSK